MQLWKMMSPNGPYFLDELQRPATEGLCLHNSTLVHVLHVVFAVNELHALQSLHALYTLHVEALISACDDFEAIS